MNEGLPVSVRFTEDEKKKIEEAMALKGYRHMSRFIRDKVFGTEGGASNTPNDWIWREELSSRLAELERQQLEVHGMLSIVIHLLSKKTPTGDMSELRAELDHALQMGVPPERLLAKLEPNIQSLLGKIMESSDAAT